jgi:hypothetical protein
MTKNIKNMKKIVIFLIFISNMINCKKKDIETPEQINANRFEACFKDKELPVLPKKDMYIEGEIDGRFFSISENADLSLECSVNSFYQLGYKAGYANPREWQGNGFDVFTFGEKPQFSYGLSIGFPAFQGDSIAYLKYFEQFQKGKTFTFLNFINKDPTPTDFTKLGTISFSFTIFGGCSEAFAQNVMTSSSVEDQTGSYCKVADVKEYKLANGQIFRRDVTIEFDVKIGGRSVPLKRIKNGRFVFSY